MTLAVLSDVNEQPLHRGWKFLAPDLPWVPDTRRIDSPDARLASRERLIQFGQKLFARGPGVRFRLHRLHLLFRKLATRQVGREPVRRSSQVPDVESGRSESLRFGPQLLRREAFGVSGQLMPNLFE